MNENIHSESNFKPEEYEVVAYLDNQPPKFFPWAGLSGEGYAEAVRACDEERKFWNAEMDRYFPGRRDGHQGHNIHKCTHCGNTNVRYIVACLHKPSGQHVVFGDICVDRLAFANRDEFKAAQVRARAEQGNARLRIYAARQQFLAEHPQLQPALDEISAPIHARNSFAQDIVAKFNQYGSLSDRQLECLLTSLARDHEYAAKKAAEAQEVKGPVPTGRVEFNAEILSVQERETDFGPVTKILVKLENNSRVWMTLPAKACNANRGDKLRFRATLEASKDDASFGFGKRPTVMNQEAVASV